MDGKYPYLRNMVEYTLFTSKEEVEQLRNSEKIKVGSREVSIEFLKKILNNDFYFEYALRYFNNDIGKVAVSYIIGGDTSGITCYERVLSRWKNISKDFKDDEYYKLV